ncbi:MAG TPA: hypothetical protein VES73_05695, partial [Lamprocystis sp. (in: g-proteobacteria)]|nr:hypothetical protein [Lamprocystis sp. (in: g-proteobacteria)]
APVGPNDALVSCMEIKAIHTLGVIVRAGDVSRRIRIDIGPLMRTLSRFSDYDNDNDNDKECIGCLA